jgi:hypothetical protein
MNSSTIVISPDPANYNILAPIAILFDLIAILNSLFILILVSKTKQLHTVTHLLTCDTCIASLLYCSTQSNNYIYVLFITWDTNDQSCRWRGYFGYLSIVAMVYSYLIQAISRFFLTILSTKYRWITSWKIHFYLIFIKWILVFILPLPAIVTHDIYFRKNAPCWVTKTLTLHVVYTVTVYYIIPIMLIVGIYIFIYIRIRYNRNNTIVQAGRRNQNRDLEVLRNIMILFSIYILGGAPTTLYILLGINVFYSMSVITLSAAVTVEKLTILVIDREIRNTCKKYFCQRKNRVTPITGHILKLAR